MQPTSDSDIKVFTTKKPTKEYIELKYIQVRGSEFNRPEKLFTKLKQKTKEEGADAVINVEYDFQRTWPIVSGTSIKYQEN